jgi:hypothetical protein
MCDDVKECCEGANGTGAAKRCEHVLEKIKDVVCLAVVRIEENLNMFPGCLYNVGMGAIPYRRMFEYRSDCNRDSLHPNLSLSPVVVWLIRTPM